MRNRNKRHQKTKPLIFVLLAKDYTTDTRVNQEVNSLVKNGFRAYVVGWDRENLYDNIKNDGIVVKHLTLLPSRLFNKLVYILSALLLQIAIIFKGVFLMLKEPGMIIHANDFNTLPAGAILKIFFPRNVKLVYDSHEHTPSVYGEWFSDGISKIVSFVEKMFIKLVDVTITVSDPIKNYLSEIFPKEIYVIRNYPIQSVFPEETKEEARKKLGYSNDEFLVIYIGLMRLDIAIPEIIEAANILQKNQNTSIIKFIWVGDGPLFDYVINKQKELNLFDIMEITGRIERERALLYLKASDLSLVLITGVSYNSRIGSPWKLFESLSSQVPVMVKSGSNMAKIVKKYQAGIVLDDLSGMSIAQNIDDLAKSKKIIKFDVQSKFTWESQEEKFLKIYNKLI